MSRWITDVRDLSLGEKSGEGREINMYIIIYTLILRAAKLFLTAKVGNML